MLRPVSEEHPAGDGLRRDRSEVTAVCAARRVITQEDVERPCAARENGADALNHLTIGDVRRSGDHDLAGLGPEEGGRAAQYQEPVAVLEGRLHARPENDKPAQPDR
jgi:hypothetical protein